MSTCPPTIRSRQYLSGPGVNFIPIVGQPIGGAQYDLLVQLPQPSNVFFIASTKHITNTLMLSLTPTGKSNPLGISALTFLGTESWFPMSTAQQVGGSNYLTVLKFKEKVNQIYLSMGTESGGQNFLTLACLTDDDLSIVGGLYT